MALVFKIKHEGTLRRWVVSQGLPQTLSGFSVSVHELLLKVREFFHFSEDDVLVITYVDNEGDIVTIADDQDLVDACCIQGFNPLRLEVKVLGNGQKSVESVENSSSIAASLSPNFHSNAIGETISRPAFPQATAEVVKQFLAKCAQNIDPNLQPAVLISHIRKALKEFVKTLVHEGQKLSPLIAQNPILKGPPNSPCTNRPPVCSDDRDQIVHFGVRCDGCNCDPIRGLRYKSTKVFNYDLCFTCFCKMGNESDYERIVKPVACRGSFHTSTENGKRVPAKWANPFASGSDGWKSQCSFLKTQSYCPANNSKIYDASFVRELSDYRGKDLMPSTHFTRTLRFKNNGPVPWPQGTCLVFIEGDNLSLESTVLLKLPEGGLGTGLEFDASVDMKAPDKAGNYISHWCLMAPNGDKFGQIVWMAIQVVGETNPLSHNQNGSRLNEMVQSKEEHVKPEKKVEHTEVSKVDHPSVTLSKDLGSDMTAHGNSVMQATESEQLISEFKGNENISYPTVEVDGFSLIQKPGDGGNLKMAHASLISSVVVPPPSLSVVDEQYGRKMSAIGISRQELNLSKLELMGFKNHNLNVSLLEKNEQDLQRTLDDLLLGPGWENLLKDLQEMGFDDENTNLRLLVKNEGSLKRVVKELVELEKGESDVPIV